jgi:hypothetical protein
MEIKELETLLENTKYSPFIGYIKNVALKNYTYKDLFKIGNETLEYFALKTRTRNKKYILDSIKHLNVINDPENIINKNIDIIEKDDLLIIISEWLNGKQPIDTSRGSLPTFFSKLAWFNKNNIVNGPYTSMYTDGNYFETIDDLVDWEINYHKQYFIKTMEENEIIRILQNLKKGLGCIIMEDMNTGNLYITNDGHYKIIDTDWIIKGLNLYQFEKIDYFGFEERKWYNINDESKECYEAYFDELGIKIDEANEQIRAFELLQVLRKNTYLKYFKKDNDKEIEKRIKTVIEEERYI